MLCLKDIQVPLNSVAFSPDGTLLAAAGYRGQAQLWDARSGKLLRRLLGGAYSFDTVLFTADGSAVLGSEFGVWGWGLAREGSGVRPARDDVPNGPAASTDLSPDGTRLARAEERSLACYAIPGLAPVWRVPAGPPGHLSALAYSPDGRRLFTGGYSGAVAWHDAGSGATPEAVTSCPGWVKALDVSPDGRLLACAAGRDLFLWGLDPLREVAHHRPGRTHYLSVAFHPSGRLFASSNGDGVVDFWSTSTGERLSAFDWGVGKLHDVAFSPDGDRAACCGKSGHIVVWDVEAS